MIPKESPPCERVNVHSVFAPGTLCTLQKKVKQTG